MPDLESLRRLGDRVIPPPFEAITRAARRRDRRSAAMAVTVTVAAFGLVVAGVVVMRGLGSTELEPAHPPATSPTPTISEESKPSQKAAPLSAESMTPEEVVTASDAELESVAVAPGDPDVRISLWHALCHWCPDRPDGRGGTLGPPTFTGMAITTDGYASATYARHPFSSVLTAVHSPRDDLFLVADNSNGREWLVDLDGNIRRVDRVDSELRPTDPRLWFVCARAGGWTTTWCSLDPDTATAYVWPEEWNRSTVPPYARDEPWGWSPASTATYEDPGVVVEAWWYVDGDRRSRVLATDARAGGIAGTPAGELAYWTWQIEADEVDLHTSDDRGATWSVETRAAPGFNRWLEMTRSPDGALLAWSSYPHLVVWRAEGSGAGFQRVYAVRGPELAGAGLWTQSDVVHANGSGAAGISVDGGLTWTTIQDWR
jgi:hypothetical protein